jgi:PAS domain S-box-containing protein
METSMPVSDNPKNGTKLLLVDDEEGIRKVLKLSLEDIGYTVFTAESAARALEIFRKIHPLIVLTDIKMPGMDGIDLLQQIKKEIPDTEVIMITGHGDMDLAIKSLQNEAVDFVTKPIDEQVLEIALKRAHEKIDMRNQLRQYTENLENLVQEQSARLVEAERQLAVGQALTGLSSAIRGIAGDLDGDIRYFNEMPCYVSVHNRELKIVETNQLFKQRIGDRLGHNSWEIYAHSASDRRNCPTALTFKTRRGQRIRDTIRCSDGQMLPVIIHTAPITNQEGQLELVLEIAADITEVERLQKELRTTQQRYQQLFDEVPCYISVQDRQLKLTAANRRFKEDFGEDVDCFCHQVCNRWNQTCPECPVAQTFTDGQSHHAEMAVTSKRGERYNVVVWTAPIRNAAGEITQVMEMATNVTEIRRLQDNLTSLGFLISSISHNLKGMLTGLDGGMYLINAGINKNEPEQLEEGRDVLQLMTGRIRNIVSNILFYAKERKPQWEIIDVRSFAEDLYRAAEHKICQHQIDFHKTFAEGLGEFEIDPNMIRIALINVLENAVDAVVVDSAKARHRITFNVSQDENHIIFQIRDNGIGMDEDTRANMFTLFFSSKGHAGTGLGLYISNNIIRQHGGWMQVDSSLGKGSHFRITVPKRQPSSASEDCRRNHA